MSIHSGNSDAILQPVLYRNIQHSPHIDQSSYEGSKTILDRTPPAIVKLLIPDRSYKIKDTIPISIITQPDTSSFRLLEGHLSGYPMLGWRKQNDSLYNAFCVITTGGNEIKASDAHSIFWRYKTAQVIRISFLLFLSCKITMLLITQDLSLNHSYFLKEKIQSRRYFIFPSTLQ